LAGPGRRLVTGSRSALLAAVLATGAAALLLASRPSSRPLVAQPWGEGAPQRREVELERDRREAWTLDAPGRLDWRARIPAGARLRLALAVRPANAGVRIRLKAEGRVLLDEAWGPTETVWRDRNVDLAGFAGRGVRFELTAQGGPASVFLGTPTLLAPPDGPDRPNVILYVVDCLRADHVGAYGYPRPTTPEIDRLARDGVVFESVDACATWTKPSVSCLFTAAWPWVHGARTVDAVLDERLPTLAERFRAQGWTTAAWVANPFVASATFGLTRGFERAFQTIELPPRGNINDLPADAANITRPVVDWLVANRDRRFFLYLHSLDLHEGYRRRPGFAQRFLSPERLGEARQLDLYDNELAYNDHEIGRLLTTLARLGLYDRTLVAITADHGEEFGKHGVLRHGHSLYQAGLHVPLILKLPGSAHRGTRVAGLASNIDIAPTLLELAGLAAPEDSAGRSLVPALSNGAWQGRDLVLAEQVSSREIFYAARGPRYKLIRQLIPRTGEWLFDLRADPGEMHSLLPDVPEAARGLAREVASLVQTGLGGWSVAVSAPPDARTVVNVTTAGTIGDVQHVPIHNLDEVAISADRHRLDFSFVGGNRHLVLRVDPPEGELRVSGSIDGASVPAAEFGVGAQAEAPSSLPVRVLSSDVAVSTAQATLLLAQARPPWRVWYVTPPPEPPKASIDTELEQKLRALGYIR